MPEPDDFVLTFFGALTAGAVPVPLYPPQTLARLDAVRRESSRVAEVARRSSCLPATARSGATRAHPPTRARSPRFQIVRAERMAGAPEVSTDPGVPVGSDDLAFLQFTSGST